MVGSGRTGHAESVAVTFDPQQISYGKILQIYFSVAHNPTELNRQGPDAGTQYRSAIFYANDEQKKIADAYIAATRQGARLPAADRDPARSACAASIRLRIITRTSPCCTRPIRTSCSTTCLRWTI